jgi:hypothetical protein
MSQSSRCFLLSVPLAAILAGWYATSTLPAAKPPTPIEIPWVRTSGGWEKAWWLKEPDPPTASPVHPALVATLMLFSSVGLLLIGQPSAVLEEPSDCFLQVAAEDRL